MSVGGMGKFATERDVYQQQQVVKSVGGESWSKSLASGFREQPLTKPRSWYLLLCIRPAKSALWLCTLGPLLSQLGRHHQPFQHLISSIHHVNTGLSFYCTTFQLAVELAMFGLSGAGAVWCRCDGQYSFCGWRATVAHIID
jgi:hypothetical protein